MAAEIKDAVKLLETIHEGFLATLENGLPFVSAAGFIYEPGGEKGFGNIFLFLSNLARHTKNLRKNPEISLAALAPGERPVYERPRVTAQGNARVVGDESQIRILRDKYKKVFPGAEMLFSFPDFNFFRIEISEIHFVAGFGNIQTFK